MMFESFISAIESRCVVAVRLDGRLAKYLPTFHSPEKIDCFCRYRQLIVEAGGRKIVNEGKWKMSSSAEKEKQQRETSSDTKSVNTDEQIRMYAKVNTASSEVLALSRRDVDGCGLFFVLHRRFLCLVCVNLRIYEPLSSSADLEMVQKRPTHSFPMTSRSIAARFGCWRTDDYGT
jgi:hypothetical protein